MITTIAVVERAVVEVINFSPEKSWLRWYLPDFSDNGNVDLPEGNWKIASREGCKLNLEKI